MVRFIKKQDDEAIASVIRNTLVECSANKPGTVFYDKSTDHLSELFKENNSCYFVVEENGEILGGAGIYPTEALPAGMCELVKMYLLPAARGKGLGKLLMQKCIAAAEDMGYSSIYLETMPELTEAVRLYKKTGFEFIPDPIGYSGHHGCELFMLKYLGNRYISA